VRLLPTGADALLVHGAGDTTVPVDQSERWAAAATAAGDRVRLDVVPGDHMVLIEPAGAPWRLVRDWVTGRATSGPGRPTLEP
jgi:fermentation-respiration switch protein FrsA (DUF1100 family)